MNSRLQDRLSEWTLLARGNVSACYRAKESVLGRTVLIKTLQSALSSDGDLRARFAREARAVARIDHANVVRLLEFGEDPEYGLYMMLEWVDGETLADKLKRNRFSAEELNTLACDLLAGLGALHRAGIVHRDIKPENVLMRRDGVLKITDFSLAALRDEPRLTHHDGIVGTPAYMSPEQAAGKTADARSDLYAVGVVLYEAATGSNPFASDDLIETLRRIRQVQPELEEQPELPPELLPLLRACLDKNPSKRPSQAGDALKLVSSVAIPAPSRVTRKRLWAVGIMVSGLAVVVAIALFVRMDSKTKIETSQTLRESPTSQTGSSTKDTSVNVKDTASLTVQNTPSESRLRDTTDRIAQPLVARHDITQNDGKALLPQPDSANITLQVEPWANILCDNRRIGTSPFRHPVKLATGKHMLTFENSALPRVDLPVTISRDSSIQVDLAQFVVMVTVEVQPWGEVFVNDERVGTTPLARPLFYPPGEHSIRIVHSNLPPLARKFTATGGDTVGIVADLDRSTLVVKHSLKNASALIR